MDDVFSWRYFQDDTSRPNAALDFPVLIIGLCPLSYTCKLGCDQDAVSTTESGLGARCISSSNMLQQTQEAYVPSVSVHGSAWSSSFDETIEAWGPSGRELG